MPKNKKPRCFIMMPISTPSHLVERYGGDPNHFRHVYECLIEPAFEGLEVEPVYPEAKGDDVIHERIVRRIEECEFAICDMSSLNANVFFELGLRTAANKPAALIIDRDTNRIPFDLGLVNTHYYNHDMRAFVVKDEIPRLRDHLAESFTNGSGNKLWELFKLQRAYDAIPTDVASEQDTVLSMLKDIHSSMGGGLSSQSPSRIRLRSVVFVDQAVFAVRMFIPSTRMALAKKIEDVVGEGNDYSLGFFDVRVSVDTWVCRANVSKHLNSIEVRELEVIQ